jgi:hypothetical protein
MVKRLRLAEKCLRVALVLALAVVPQLARPASPGLFPLKHPKPTADANQTKAMSASQPASLSIPVEPLGFYAPGAFYMGMRESLVSLDFLDENRLLFTFRAPGLIHRTNPADDEERQIRAEVLTLPQGTVETEALWTLHDHERYLWILKDGHFLLRDGDTLKEGNAKLELRPLLQFPGPLLWLEMDPAQHYLVTDSDEPADVKPQRGQVQSPSTAAATVSSDISGASAQKDVVLRILERASGRVMLVSRVRTTVHLPINSEAYIETLRGNGRNWLFNLNYFTGGTRVLGKLDSTCQPPIEFISHDEALVNTCLPQDGRRLVALSLEGRWLWDAVSPPTQIWPLLVMAPDGSRLARETLTIDHPIDDFAHPLDAGEIKGQLVEVYDSIGGALALRAPASPALDGGGNIAISPSGKRVAILNDGAIQVYDLPAPQQQPDTRTAAH